MSLEDMVEMQRRITELEEQLKDKTEDYRTTDLEADDLYTKLERALKLLETIEALNITEDVLWDLKPDSDKK